MKTHGIFDLAIVELQLCEDRIRYGTHRLSNFGKNERLSTLTDLRWSD